MQAQHRTLVAEAEAPVAGVGVVVAVADAGPSLSEMDTMQLCRPPILLFLLVAAIDTLGDALVESNMQFYLGDYLGLGDVAVTWVIAFYYIHRSLFGILGGNFIDRYPARGGPLTAGGRSKAFALFAFCVWLTLPLVVLAGPLPAFFTALVLAVIWWPYAAGEAMGALAFTISMRRMAYPLFQDKLSPLLYGTQNMGFLASSTVTTSWRVFYDGGGTHGEATIAIFATALPIFAGAGLLAVWTQRCLFRGGYHRRPKEAVTTVVEDYLPSVEGWRALLVGEAAHQFRTYALAAACMMGTETIFFHVATTLPKYMIRHFGETLYFPLFQAINPAVIIVLATLLPFLPFFEWGHVTDWIIGGMALQVLSLLWVTLGDAEWAVVVFQLQFTLGEALGMTRVAAYIARLAPDGQLAGFRSLVAMPMMFLQALVTLSSGWLLEAYCPMTSLDAPDECRPVLWYWVMAVAALSPVALFVVTRLWRRLPVG